MDLTTAVRLSCLLEASARKAGNVHPEARFEHLTYDDFVRSGQVVAPILSQAAVRGVGPVILDAVRATRSVCNHNTNLGIILLLTPLAAVPADDRTTDGVANVLSNLTRADSDAVYEAIRVAAPRGLGDAETEDVSVGPTGNLVEVMTLAADRDLIAAQYATGFSLVVASASRLQALNLFPDAWESAILQLQLEQMSRHKDTAISRKSAMAEAVDSATRAAEVLDAGVPTKTSGRQRFAAFDAWLREHGSLRNPGTTADLITASLFVAICEQLIVPPTEHAVRQHVRDCQIPSQ